ICDVVEFVEDDKGVEISGDEGKYVPYPIEYKRGKPKKNDSDILQLTAQAICLEEMLLCEIDTDYMFYNEIKQRIEVPLTTQKKNKVKTIVTEKNDDNERKYIPKIKTCKVLKNFSLKNICLSNIMNKRYVKSYIKGKI